MNVTREITAALVAAFFFTQAAQVCGADKRAAKDDPVYLITLDPGHFHAALVQKFMLPGVSKDVLVYAPRGDDLDQHLKRIEAFNKRADAPTHWNQVVESGPQWFEEAMKPKVTINVPIHGPGQVESVEQRIVVV